MNEDLEIEIELPERSESYSIGETIKGQLVIQSKKDITIDYLRCRLLFESRGLIRSNSIVIDEVLLLEGVDFKEKQRNVYPIEFKNTGYETYKGKNIELLSKLDVSVKPRNVKISNKILSRIANLGRSEVISKSRYIDFDGEDGNFEIASSKVKLELDPFDKILLVSLLVLIIIGFLIANTKFYESYKSLLIVLGIGVLILNLVYSYFAKYRIGEIEAEFKDKGNHQFGLKLNSKHGLTPVKKIEIKYHIYEEVIDNRGTSQTKEVSRIYTSEVKTLGEGINGRSITFDYPKKKPQTMSYKDVRIYWMIELRLYLMLGMQFCCKEEFEVKKKCP